MKPLKRLTALAILAAFTAVAPIGASAETRGKTVDGMPYVTGGVTVAELIKLQGERDKYSLWITTAAVRSGAHLSDVKLRITDAKKRVVLDTMMIGPWLMVDLPLGRYSVEAKFKDQTFDRVTQIHKDDHHQVLIYFDVPAEVSPDWVSPFRTSPYSGL